MASRYVLENYAPAMIDAKKMTLTEIGFEGEKTVHDLREILNQWSGVPNISLTLECGQGDLSLLDGGDFDD